MTSQITWCGRCLMFSPYYYALCTSPQAFQRELRSLGITEKALFLRDKNSGATTHYFEGNVKGRGRYCAIVCIYPPALTKFTSIDIAAMLVHEAMHIWRLIRENLGEDSPSTELEAYAMQNISSELMYAYAQQTKGRK